MNDMTRKRKIYMIYYVLHRYDKSLDLYLL